MRTVTAKSTRAMQHGSTLKVWRDDFQDGYSEPSELHALAEFDIASIGVGYANASYVDAQGNAHKQIGSFTRTDGSTGEATDVWFKVDYARTTEVDLVEVPNEIAALADVSAFGNVHSLHQAMARDESGDLKTLVEQFSTAQSTAERKALFTSLICEWTGAADVSPTSRGSYIDARKVVVLEQLLGDGGC